MIKISDQDDDKLIMLFHTSLRNIGLFTSIALALLGYSRYYRGKNILYNVSFIILNIAFITIALYLDFILIDTINASSNNKKIQMQNILYSLFFLLIIILLFSVYTLFRQII